MDTLLEKRRQLLHLIIGVVLIFTIYFNIMSKQILLFLTLMSIALSLIHTKIKIPIISWLLEKFERKHTHKLLPGQGFILFLIGALFPFYILSKNYALASLTILTVGDSIAPLAGIYLGKIKLPFSKSKKLEGLFAGTFSSFLFSMIFIAPLQALLTSMISMAIESLKLKIGSISIDDNLLIPITASTIFLIILSF